MMKYIKYKIQLKLQFTLVLLLSVLTISSCINDDNEIIDPNKGTGLVTFSVKVPGQSLPSTYASLSDDQENEIETIDVLVFNEVGEYLGVFLSPENLTKQGNDVLFTVRIPEGEKLQINVFANARDLLLEMKDHLVKSKLKKDVLSVLLLNQTGKWITDSEDGSYRALPMWGEIPRLTVNSNTPSSNTVKMIRMHAKVNVILNPELAVRVDSIFVVKASQSGLLGPLPDRWDGNNHKVTGTSTYGLRNKTPLIYGLNNNQSKNDIYLFESDNTASSVQGSERTCLIIKGHYNGKSNYYRLDFGNYSGGNMSYVDILRNHSYTFHVNSINKEGSASITGAINSEPINIGGGVGLVTVDSDNIGYAVFNATNYLGVTAKEMSFEALKQTNQDTNLYIGTDVPTGYKILKVIDDRGVEWPDWATVGKRETNRSGIVNCDLVLQENPPGSVPRTVDIYIEAGPFSLIVKITQNSPVAT